MIIKILNVIVILSLDNITYISYIIIKKVKETKRLFK